MSKPFPQVVLASNASSSPVTATRLRLESWIQEQLLLRNDDGNSEVTTTTSNTDLFLSWTNESSDIVSDILKTSADSFSSLKNNDLVTAAITRITKPDRLEFSKEIMKAVARAAMNQSSNNNINSNNNDLNKIAQNAGRYFANEITTLLYDIFDLKNKNSNDKSTTSSVGASFLNPANNKNFQVAPPLHDEYYGRLNFALRWIEVVSVEAAVIFASSPSPSSFTAFHDEFKKSSRKAYDTTFRTLMREYVEYILTTLSPSSSAPFSNRVVYVHFALLRLRRLTTIVASMSSRTGGATATNAASRQQQQSTMTHSRNHPSSMAVDSFDAYHQQDDDSANVADLAKLSDPATLAKKLINYCGVHHEIVSSRNAGEEERERFQTLKAWQQLTSSLLESVLTTSSTSSTSEAHFTQMPAKQLQGLSYEKSFNVAQVSEKQEDLYLFVKHFGHGLKTQLEKVQIKSLQNLFDKLATAAASNQNNNNNTTTNSESKKGMTDEEVVGCVDQILAGLSNNNNNNSGSSSDAAAPVVSTETGLTSSEILSLVSKHLSSHAAPVVKTWVTKQRLILDNKLFTPETVAVVNNRLLMRFFKNEVIAAVVDRTFTALNTYNPSSTTSTMMKLSGNQALATIGSLYRADPLPEKVLQALNDTTKQLQQQQTSATQKQQPLEPQLNLAWNLVRETLIDVLAEANPRQLTTSSSSTTTSSSEDAAAVVSDSKKSTTAPLFPLGTFLKNEDQRSTDAQASIFGAAILMLAYNLALDIPNPSSSSAAGTGVPNTPSSTNNGVGAFPTSSSTSSDPEGGSSKSSLAWSAICNFLDLSPAIFSKVSPKKQVVSAILRLASSSSSESQNCQTAAAIVLAAVPAPIVMPPTQISSSSSTQIQLSSHMAQSAIFQGMFRTKPFYCPLIEEKLVELAAAFTHIFTVESVVIKDKIKEKKESEKDAAKKKTSGSSTSISGDVATAALHTTIALQLAGRSFPMLFFCPYTPTLHKLNTKESPSDMSCSQYNLVRSVDGFWYDLSRNSSFSALVVTSAKHIADRFDYMVGDVDLKPQGFSNPSAPSLNELHQRALQQHHQLYNNNDNNNGGGYGGFSGRGGRGRGRPPPPPPPPSISSIALSKSQIARTLSADGGFCSAQDAQNIFYFKSLMMLMWLARYDADEKTSEHAISEAKHILRTIKKRLVDRDVVQHNQTTSTSTNDNANDAVLVGQDENQNNDIKINNSTAILAPLQMIAKLLHREDLIIGSSSTSNNPNAPNFFFKQPRNAVQDNSSSKTQHVTNLLNLPWLLSCGHGGAILSGKWRDLDDRDKAKPYSFIDTVIRSFEVAFRKAEHEMSTVAIRQPARNPYSEYEKNTVSAIGKFVYDKIRDVIRQPQALKTSQTITEQLQQQQQQHSSSSSRDIQSLLKSYFSIEKVNSTVEVQVLQKKKEQLERTKAEIVASLEQHSRVTQDGEASEDAKSKNLFEGEKKKEQPQQQSTSDKEKKDSLSKKLTEIDAKLASTKYSQLSTVVAHIHPQDFVVAFARNLSIFIVTGNPIEAVLLLEAIFFSPHASDFLFNSSESVLDQPLNLLKELVDGRLRGMIEFLTPVEVYNYSVFLRLLFSKIIIPLCKKNTNVQTQGESSNTGGAQQQQPKYLTSSTFPFQYLFKNSAAKSILPVEVVYLFQTMPYTVKDLVLQRFNFTVPELRGSGFDAINSYELGSYLFTRQLASPAIPVFSFLDVAAQLRTEIVPSEKSVLSLIGSHYKNVFFAPYTKSDGVLADKETRIAFSDDQKPRNTNTRDFCDLVCGKFFDLAARAVKDETAPTGKFIGALGELIEIRSFIFFYLHPLTVIRGHPFDEQKFQAEEESAKVQRREREEREARERALHEEERRKKRDHDERNRDHKRLDTHEDANNHNNNAVAPTASDKATREDQERSERRSRREGGGDRDREKRRDGDRERDDERRHRSDREHSDRKKRHRSDRERDEERVRSTGGGGGGGGGRSGEERERDRERDRERERDRNNNNSNRDRDGERSSRRHHHEDDRGGNERKPERRQRSVSPEHRRSGGGGGGAKRSHRGGRHHRGGVGRRH